MTAPTGSPVSSAPSSTTTGSAAATTGAVPAASSDRTDQFRRDLAEMKIREPRVGLDGVLLKLGLLGLVAGIVVAIIAYTMSHGTDNPLQQRDAFTIGLIGVTISIAGAALFLRYSLAGFLRFWLARFLFEQQRINAEANQVDPTRR
jgi:hypothetical protein